MPMASSRAPRVGPQRPPQYYPGTGDIATRLAAILVSDAVVAGLTDSDRTPWARMLPSVIGISRAADRGISAPPRAPPSLVAISATVPGSRALSDGFADFYSAMAAPKRHEGRFAYIDAFIEDAKTSGHAPGRTRNCRPPAKESGYWAERTTSARFDDFRIWPRLCKKADDRRPACVGDDAARI
jgi:hypothetical protein